MKNATMNAITDVDIRHGIDNDKRSYTNLIRVPRLNIIEEKKNFEDFNSQLNTEDIILSNS